MGIEAGIHESGIEGLESSGLRFNRDADGSFVEPLFHNNEIEEQKSQIRYS